MSLTTPSMQRLAEPRAGGGKRSAVLDGPMDGYGGGVALVIANRRLGSAMSSWGA